jgi:hypothetical protein
MKTIGVKLLVRQVLDKLPTPHTEHVIDDVFHAIEQSPEYLPQYDRLCQQLGKHVVNTWCGQWIANALEKTGEVQVPRRKSSLIGSYSLLDALAEPVRRKPNETEALQMMSDYYRANRTTLPGDIRVHRDAIVELIMAGVPPESAFAAVQQKGA